MFKKDNLAIRSLTGTNVFFTGVGSIAEYVTRDQRLSEFVISYETMLKKTLDSLGWKDTPIYKKIYSRGVIFAIPTEFDLTYAGCKILSIVFDLTSSKFNEEAELDFEEEIDYLQHVISKECYITLREIYNEAKSRGLNFYLKNNVISIGSGRGTYTANIDDISFADVPWSRIYEIPSVLVTGTNGKTTTVRLTSFISSHAGKVVGYCSTEGVTVAGETVQGGDMAGPEGNRLVMTNPLVDVAVLEVARGGIVKRGLATSHVDAAVVINVSEDHLGLNGVDNIEDLASAKFTIHDAIRSTGHNIVNLDDPSSSKFIRNLSRARAFFSQTMPEQEIITYCTLPGDYACMIIEGEFVVYRDGIKHKIAKVNEVDLTYNGLARHNVENVLASIALSLELGRTYEEIRGGLLAFVNSENNLGRFNLFEIKGTKFLIDYGHNLASIDNMLKFARSICKPDGKITTLLGFSGDRKFLIDSIAKSVVRYNIDYVILKMFTNYLRGAEVGEVASMLHNSLLKNGYPEKNIIATVEQEIDALEIALAKLYPNDIYVLFCQNDVIGVIDKLKSLERGS